MHGSMLQILVMGIFPLLLLSCGSERVDIEFKTSREFFVDDSRTDPDKFNRELEHDLRQAEKKRLQKQREAEAAAKAKAEEEKKAKEAQQKLREQTAEEEITQPEESEQSPPQ